MISLKSLISFITNNLKCLLPPDILVIPDILEMPDILEIPDILGMPDIFGMPDIPVSYTHLTLPTICSV